jgi:glycosyltransferase involved in cell wall biosynthesis
MTATQRSSPRISIVVPCYNAGRWLATTLDSIRAQTERNWEAIIVDDGSSDDSVEVAHAVAAHDGRIRVIEQANAGASAARNTGFRASDPASAYVTFMDADDVWLPDALATLRARLEREPEAIGAHGLADTIDADGVLSDPGGFAAFGRHRVGRQGRRLVVWPLDRPTEFDILINNTVLFPPGLILTRRSAYAAVGPFDPALALAEDYDMLVRLTRLGPIAFVDQVILHYRRHDANGGAQAGNAEWMWHVRCKAFHSPENSPAQARAARAGWRAYQLTRMAESRQGLAAAVRHGRPAEAALELARFGVFVARYVRGYPLPRVTSEPLHW